jgi:deoxyribose-phosphate aldolase
VVRAAGGRVVKAIIETWVLTDEQIIRACRLVEEAGAHMAKTTTGVRTQYLDMIREGARGAEVKDVKLMRAALGPSMKIKASGGIYTLDDALELIRAGADQLGVSRGEEIVGEFTSRYGERVEL